MSTSPSPAVLAETRALFSEGVKLFSAGEHPKALDKFKRAHSLMPAAALRFNVGRCLESLDPGTHTIEASAPGYATATKTVVLRESTISTHAIDLHPR